MKWKLFLAWVLSYAYILIKYTIYDTSDSTATNLVASFVYFIPFGLFALSSFLFIKEWVGPKVRYGAIFLISAGLTVAGCYVAISSTMTTVFGRIIS